MEQSPGWGPQEVRGRKEVMEGTLCGRRARGWSLFILVGEWAREKTSNEARGWGGEESKYKNYIRLLRNHASKIRVR